MSDDTKTPAHCFVCRCEEIDEAMVQAAIAAGARTINDVKRRTRAGMGICQGVYCLQHIAALLARELDCGVETVVPMTARPPARMLTLSALAGEEPPR